ncbi:MAG: penicillin-binding protein activator LpoB [Spirochaetaceae bacterium]|nr:penicillin-binding protein activator LpoB [Spirochaetaceae bacterium]
MKNFYLSAIIIVITFALISCNSGTRVTRVDLDSHIDLSGRWNDSDSQLVAQEMIRDAISHPWINNFARVNNRTPVVIVGEVRNRSREHIETLAFTKDLERELINSGRVRFVASADERQGIRDERLDQQTQSSAETMKRLGQETGADFYLGGVITSEGDAITTNRGQQRVIRYITNLELTHIETNERVWIGRKEIRKFIEQPRRGR